MLLKPTAITDLSHRAYYLRGAPGRNTVVAAAGDGSVSTIEDFRLIHGTRVADRVSAISPHPKNATLAWIEGNPGKLAVLDPLGRRGFEIFPPSTQSGTWEFNQKGFEDCRFDESGERLWLAAHIGNDDVELSVVDGQTGTLISKSVVHDPFGESSCSFHTTNWPGRLALWLAAGQDGQIVYWLHASPDGFTWDQEVVLQNTTPPAFCADGSTFLVCDECGGIAQYDYATGRKLGPTVRSPDEDGRFAESHCYLDSDRAIAATNEGRVFLIDTRRMAIVDEVVVEGHEPRPIHEYYPTLKDSDELATDISWFKRVNDSIAFIVRRDPGIGLDGWTDSLLWYRTNT